MERKREERYRSRRLQERMGETEPVRNKTHRRRRKKKPLRIFAHYLTIALMVSGLVAIGYLGFVLVREVTQGEESVETVGLLSEILNQDKGTVMLDPGHGGSDKGTASGGVLEKDVTLQVAQMVRDILKKDGYEVLMTRTDDSYIDKYGRAELANEEKPEIFVSIHCNSLEDEDQGITGIETYYSMDSAESETLATGIHNAVVTDTGAFDRKLMENDYVVLRDTTMPAALVEVGYLSESEERALLVKVVYQQKIAAGIAEGIEQYLESDPQEAVEETKQASNL